MLHKQNTTEDFIKRRIEDQLMVEKVTASLFSEPETQVSDEEMKNYFRLHENEFIRAERVMLLAKIVVPTREEAEKIKTQVASNEITFESAARKYSLSPGFRWRVAISASFRVTRRSRRLTKLSGSPSARCRSFDPEPLWRARSSR